MVCYILVHLSRIMFTHGTSSSYIYRYGKMLLSWLKSSSTILYEMVCWRNWLIGISINSNRLQIWSSKLKNRIEMELVHLYGYLCIRQQTFASMKALLVADTLMSYPDRNFPFHIFTNVSDFQLRNFQRISLYVIECGSAFSHWTSYFIFITLHRNSTCSPVEDLYWRISSHFSQYEGYW